MKKVIALSTVLALGALGMACGDAPANTSTNTNKPANTTTPAPSTPAPSTPAPNTNAGGGNTNAKPGDKPADTKMDNTNAKPADKKP